MKLSFFTTLVTLFAFLSFEGCYYDNEEDLYPIDPGLICDTVNVSYQNTVKAILETNCVGCHTGSFPNGNQLLDNYQSVADIANTGKLFGVINHENGFKSMPPNVNKINDCDIDKIKSWIDAGAKNN